MADGPEQFGPYRLEELIGRGGMGEVWRAYDTRRDRTVALKRLGPEHSGDPRFEARFRRESRLAAQLTAQNVIPIHDFGEIDGRLFLDMRLVPGRDLAAVLAGAALAPDDVRSVIGQLASALDAAHAAGLVHRDVKPSNALLTADGFVYLVDFGIAKQIEGGTALTTDGVVGTVAYLAPERLLGTGNGPSADVYALACVLHECLTGRPPFTGATAPAIAMAHLHAPPPRLADVDARLAVVDPVLARGLVKNPDARFASAGDMARAVSRALAQVGVEEPARWAQQGAGAQDPTSGDAPNPRAAPWAGPPTSGGATGEPAAPWAGPPTAVAPVRRRWRRPVLAIVAALLVALAAVGVATLVPRGPDPVATPSTPGPTTTAPAAATFRPLGTAAVGGRATSVALAPDGSRAYVVTAREPGSDELVVVDTATRMVLDRLPVTAAGGGLAVAPDGSSLYVPRCGASVCGLDETDAASGGALGSTRVGETPTTVVLAPDGRRAYVLLFRREAGVVQAELVTVDVRGRVVVGDPLAVPSTGSGGLAVSGDGSRIVVADGRQSVSVVDTASGALLGRPIRVGESVTDVAVDATGSRAYVTGAATDTVSVVDLASGALAAPPIPVGSGPGAIALLPDGRPVVANEFDGTVSVFDAGAGRVDGTPVPVGPGPSDLAVSADGTRIAVLSDDGTVTVLGA